MLRKQLVLFFLPLVVLLLLRAEGAVGSSSEADSSNIFSEDDNNKDKNYNICTSNSQCESFIGRGSECIDGLCSEAVSSGSSASSSGLFEGGCLYQRLEGWTKKRVCNSDDPPNAAELGVCRIPDFDYMEIRIASQNWESVFFEVYLLQILLSELLDVPTTVETGTPDAEINFYDPAMPFDYGISQDWPGLERADELQDCRKASQDPENYESCAHFIPEIWSAHENWIKEEKIQKGLVEPPAGLGLVGDEDWFVPKFTLDRDPSLASYMGLRGEKNRRKMAETFLRPAKWKDYCERVSPDNCTTPDETARRGPQDETEAGAFFAPELYTGHFWKTEKNDCDMNPTNCTGHIVDYPCGWSSTTEQLLTHLEIALESNGDEPGSGGYTYTEMVQIIHASNATKSNMMIQWWNPETSYSKFLGSDAEFQSIMLPPETQECIQARVQIDERCSDNVTVRTGNPLGVCDEPAHPLHKIISGNLFSTIYDPSIPDGRRSPAYDAIKLWMINNLQLNEIFDYWFSRTNHQSPEPGRSGREAVCDWVVDHMEYLHEFMPRTYPRALREKSFHPLLVASTALAGIATVMVLWAGWIVWHRRGRRVIRVAQIEFLWLLLAGLLILALGAIFAVYPTDGTCMAAMWLINFGYTFELVPLIVKVSAINRLMNAANKMRRVVLERKSLFGAVVVINGLVGIVLILWSVLDPPLRTPEYKLTDTVTDQGETLVTISFYCSSTSNIWRYIVVSINAVLLLWTTVLAFQSRHLRQEFNESMTLAIMVYSHTVFLILRVITFFLEGSVSSPILTHCQSLIYSVDTIATIVIYFIPKFVTSDREYKDSMKGYHVYLRRLVGSSARGGTQFSTGDTNTVEEPASRLSGPSGAFGITNGGVVANNVGHNDDQQQQPNTLSATNLTALTTTNNQGLSRRCPHCGKETGIECRLD